MENNKISIIYKNDFQSLYEAYYAYAVREGNLSKKYMIKIFVSAIAILTVITAMSLFESKVMPNVTFILSLVTTGVIFTVLSVFVIKSANKSAIKSYCKTMFEQGFDARSPKKTEFDEEKVTIQTDYSIMSIPYNEIDFVVSDRINFFFTAGHEKKIINIPKTNQNPDVLFATDNLLREKLGDKFIYKM